MKYLLRFSEKFGSITGGLLIAYLLYSLKFVPLHIEIFADKLFSIGLFMFGLCLTLFAIIHQGDNDKLRDLKKYGGINRITSFCFRVIIEALILCALCFYVLNLDKATVTPNCVIFMSFVSTMIIIDTAILLRIFFLIFHYKI